MPNENLRFSEGPENQRFSIPPTGMPIYSMEVMSEPMLTEIKDFRKSRKPKFSKLPQAQARFRTEPLPASFNPCSWAEPAHRAFRAEGRICEAHILPMKDKK